jgi:hypothetical protein
VNQARDARPLRCPAILGGRKRRGEVCGRAVIGFLAHGHGRCSYHLTERERIRVRAVIRTEREMRELRALVGRPAPEQCEEQDEAECDEGPVPSAELDPERFAGAALDE